MSCQLPAVPSKLKSLNDILGDRKLDPDAAYEAIALVLQEPQCITQKPVKALKGGGILERECHAHSKTSRKSAHLVQKGSKMNLCLPVHSTSRRSNKGA
jgi:hypothetical protein